MDEDCRVFLQEMDGVQKMAVEDRFTALQGLQNPTLQQLAARNNATKRESPNYLRDFLDESNQVDPNTVFNWRRDGAQSGVVEQLRRGRYNSDVQLDLHHKTIAEAHALIWSFLTQAMEEGTRSVLIIHGRGAKSNPPARMKSFVGQALSEHRDIFAYCSAPPDLGGMGSTLAWLRKSMQDKAETRERIQSRRG